MQTQLTQFKIAGGTVVGRDHIGRDGLLKGKNNQDAYLTDVNDFALVGVVCDGCGQHEHSEIGAQLTARLLMTAMVKCLRERNEPWSEGLRTNFWEQVQGYALSKIRELALSMAGDGSYSTILNEYFLCTALAVVVTPEEAQIAAVGDGVYAVNGTVTDLGPFPNNEPPYLVYQLAPRKNQDTQALSKLTLQKVIPTEDLESVLIGTDGVRDYREAAEARKCLPGKAKQLPALAELWTAEHYFGNPDGISRNLRLANSEVKSFEGGRLVLCPGLLKDDTTLIAIRRNASVSSSVDPNSSNPLL